MVDLTIPYLQFEDEVGFLRIKHSIIDNQIWKISFYIHVLTSCFLLIAGTTQFSARIISRYPVLHRRMGAVYIIVLLFLSGPSGLIMAIYANGGPIAIAAFLSLSILWIFTTGTSYYFLKKKDYVKHANWMTRSFALTLSAITLRIWKPSLAMSTDIGPMDLYRLVAWLGFTPNLLIAEWIIRKGWSRRFIEKAFNPQ